MKLATGREFPCGSFSDRPPVIEKVEFASERTQREMFIEVNTAIVLTCKGGADTNSIEELRSTVVETLPGGWARLNVPVLFVAPGEK